MISRARDMRGSPSGPDYRPRFILPLGRPLAVGIGIQGRRLLGLAVFPGVRLPVLLGILVGLRLDIRPRLEAGAVDSAVEALSQHTADQREDHGREGCD